MKKLGYLLILLLTLGCAKEYETMSGYIDIGKANLYCEYMGEGKPLIMIHSGLMDRRMWDDQFQYFSNKYKAIRYDIRGYGLTKSSPDTFSHYNDLSHFMEELNIEKASLIGHAMGARIAVDFALQFPEKVSVLILTSPAISGYNYSSEILANYIKAYNKAVKNDNIDEIIDAFQRAWTYGPYRASTDVEQFVRDWVKMIATESLANYNPMIKATELIPPAAQRLKQIKVPILIITGDLDMPDIHQLADFIQESAPNAKKVNITHTAHMVNMEKPNEFNKIVSKFLSK